MLLGKYLFNFCFVTLLSSVSGWVWSPISAPCTRYSFQMNMVNDNNHHSNFTTLEPDYKIPLLLLTTGTVMMMSKPSWLGLSLLIAGSYSNYRASNFRIVFDDEAMEILKKDTYELDSENWVYGGRNRWNYKNIMDWKFFPSYRFPVIVYFKQNQKVPDGQIHLFPVIANPKDLFKMLSYHVPLKKDV